MESNAPRAGSVLAMEFGRGREAICRVIAETADCPLTNRMCGKRGPTALICVVVTRWDGPTGSANVATVRRSERARQPRVFERWEAEPQWIGAWISAEAPRKPFRAIGFVPVSSAEKALAAHPDDAHRRGRKVGTRIVGMDDWDSLVRRTRAQWEWDHHRSEIVAAQRKTEAEERARDLRHARALAKARRQLAKRGIRALAKRRFFGEWRGDVPARMLAACEHVAHAAVASLCERATLSRREKLDELKALMGSFNALDGKYRHSFSTIDAETIVEAVLEIASALGISETVFDREIDSVRTF